MRPVARGSLFVAGKSGKALLLLLALAGHQSLAAGDVFAASKNAGTTGAAFLRIAAGARPAALGEAYTALADDVHAVTWNPAGLSRVTRAQFTMARAQWLQEYDHNFLAGAHPFSWGTIGFGFTSLSVQGIEKRSADSDVPDGDFGADDAAYTFSFGRSLGDTWSLGLGGTYIRQELDGRSASALAGTGGLLWRSPRQPLSVSLVARNVGSDIKFVQEGDPLPTTVSVGLGYNFMDDRLRLGLDARSAQDIGTPVSLGFEFLQPFSQDLSGALRAGYDSLSTGPTDGLSGVSAGMGVLWKSWGFDVTWAPYGALGHTFRYALLVKF